MHVTAQDAKKLLLLVGGLCAATGCATTSGACPAGVQAQAPTPAPNEAEPSAHAPAAEAPPLEVALPEGQQQHVVRVAATAFGPCPPTLPKPCEMAVLEGNPAERTLFTLRFRVPAGFAMPPHTHPRAERVTIIAGKVGVAFGAETERSQGMVFGAGDYYVNAPESVHHVWVEEDAVIQIHGIGPWVATPLATPAR